MAAARRAVLQIYDGWIVAGPVVVPPGSNTGQMFVAVAKARKGPWKEELAHCVVYEISLRGAAAEIEAMTPVPRMVGDWPCKTLSGGLLWGCERGALLRLGCYEHDFSRGFVMSGDDMLCRVQWYRELYMGLKPSWFVADPPDRVACFSQERLFRASAAFITKQAEPIYCFLISVVDLSTGLDHDLTLSIPYDGHLPKPKYGSFTPSSMHTNEPYLLWVSDLRIDGRTLRIVMSTDKDKTALDFDLASLLAAGEAADPDGQENAP